MKTRLLFLLLLLAGGYDRAFGQRELRGRVLDAQNGNPLAGASVTLISSKQTALTGNDGRFRMTASATDSVLVTYVGYAPQRLSVQTLAPGEVTFRLVPKEGMLAEVLVNTGYQTLPKERATGAFTHIDGKLLDEMVAPTLLEKLEGITNGLVVDRRVMLIEGPADGATGSLRIRGASTIESNRDPLIILDNFPYEGNLDAINPNDVASITVLRDAAAASIWGARAGNGVIVITTKKGREDARPTVSVTGNTTIGQQPDLFYSRAFLDPIAVLEVEKELFEAGRFPEGNTIALPPYVELLIKKRDGLIDDAAFAAMEAQYYTTDLRREAEKHLYRPSVNQQYALNVSGGTAAHTYYLSGGYDRNTLTTVGDGNDRLSLLARHRFRAGKRLEFQAGIRYARQSSHENAISMYNLANSARYSPLADDAGNALPVLTAYRLAYDEQTEASGLLDGLYRPLDERRLRTFTINGQDIQLDASASYKPLAGLDLSASYQLLRSDGGREYYSAAESHYARNLINRFTQADGTRIIPLGAIRESVGTQLGIAHSGRFLANYNRRFPEDWQLDALAGAEIRQQRQTNEPGYILYGFDEERYIGVNRLDYARPHPTRPLGTATIPAPIQNVSERTTRFLSYFGNGALVYRGRYTLSGSLRWDGSNLFGVKANQRGVPLWSMGGSWQATGSLRLRTTYGRSGNVNHAVSVYPTIGYTTSTFTGLRYANLTGAGNPNLRWETVSTANFGVDVSLLNSRMNGSVDYFNKFASDLLGEDRLDPTSGIVTGIAPLVNNVVNYASLRTQGVDLQLTTRNLTGKLAWESLFLFSITRNKVVRFNTAETLNADAALEYNRKPVPGESLDVLYALPWHGLDPETGRTLIYNADGNRATNYQTWFNAFPIDGLINAGVTAPPYSGSVRNTLTYAGIQLSATVTFKAGHVFRRNSMMPGGINNFRPVHHGDYLLRWQQPGDEARTVVPSSLPYGSPASATTEDRVFGFSEALVVKGDHIRLQDVRLGYTLPARVSGRMGIQQLQIYGYLRNLGLLWKNNDLGIDPDFAEANFPPPLTAAFGIQFSL